MRKVQALVIMVIISSCGSGKNELMSQLLNEKRVIEDSLKITDGGQLDYDTKAKEVLHATHDTTLAYPLSDTSNLYFALGLKLKARLEQVDFSIDSLSKMK